MARLPAALRGGVYEIGDTGDIGGVAPVDVR
jgi:hypothetical protein